MWLFYNSFDVKAKTLSQLLFDIKLGIKPGKRGGNDVKLYHVTHKPFYHDLI